MVPHTRKLSEIKIGKRIRKAFNVDSLAKSIQERGLLQPVGIRPDNTLVCGERRIRAVKKLGWEEIPVHVCKDLEEELALLGAESDENTEREPLTASEAHEMAELLTPKFKAAAETAQAEAGERGKEGGRGKKKTPVGNSHKGLSAPKTRDQAAKPTGMSEKTLRKIGEIKQKAAADPTFQPFADELDKQNCKIDGLFKRFQSKQKELKDADTAKAIARKRKTEPIPLVYHEPFTETAKRIEDNTVALIFTDPPYDTKSVPMYGDLAKVANRVLVDGGSLICYCGHRLIPKVIEQMKDSGLRFYWILACIHSGKSARMPLTGQIVTWKPMLWWIKGTERRDTSIMLEDSVRSDEPDKKTHEWQQGITEAFYYIEKLTIAGELIFEPFCGGGTTVVAAKQLGRLTIACDQDPDAVVAATERIAKESQQ